jgi:hypothetical protein
VGKPNKRKHRPVSVAEAEEILMRARRREAAQAGRTVRRRVDLANLDTPEVTPAELYAEFLNRPGRFYVATIKIPLDDKALGEKIATTTTFKADDDQLLYLVEVLRQIRGAFGQHCRINLTPAEPNVAERRIAGPAVRQARSRVEEVRVGPDPAERPATPEELAAVREMRARAEARNGFTLPPANGRYTPEDGPPMVPGVDPRWQGIAPPDRECTREELVEMLPGQTRAEVAEELGKAPEAIGGTVHHADVLPEGLAAELGVPVESLRRIPIPGGGYAWSVTPPPAEERGRHAAPEAAS